MWRMINKSKFETNRVGENERERERLLMKTRKRAKEKKSQTKPHVLTIGNGYAGEHGADVVQLSMQPLARGHALVHARRVVA